MAGACEYGNELSGSIKCGDSSLAAKPVSFSRRTLLHGVSKYSYTLSLTLAIEGGGWSSRTGRFTPRRETRHSSCRGLGEPQGRSGQVRKISLLPGFDPQTVQPVASCYTDYCFRQEVGFSRQGPHHPKASTYTVQPISTSTLPCLGRDSKPRSRVARSQTVQDATCRSRNRIPNTLYVLHHDFT